MKKISSLIMLAMLTSFISGCTLFQNPSTSPSRTSPDPAVTTPVTTASGTSAAGTLPATLPGTTTAVIDPAATTPATMPETTPVTQPATKPAATKPAATAPPVTKPSASSNLPKSIKSALDQSGNGIVLIYEPEKYPGITAITGWNVTVYDTKSQLFLVTKKKGSVVKLYDTKLTADLQDRVIDDVIRDWVTTADYEVIRIRYSDPETMTMNFIKVIEPGGKTTTTDIHSSMMGLPSWEAFGYD